LLEKQRFEDFEKQRKDTKREKHKTLCSGIVHQLVDLTAKVVEYRQLTGGENPGNELMGWKSFCSFVFRKRVSGMESTFLAITANKTEGRNRIWGSYSPGRHFERRRVKIVNSLEKYLIISVI
jgi:hypothetical protein